MGLEFFLIFLISGATNIFDRKSLISNFSPKAWQQERIFSVSDMPIFLLKINFNLHVKYLFIYRLQSPH